MIVVARKIYLKKTYSYSAVKLIDFPHPANLANILRDIVLENLGRQSVPLAGASMALQEPLTGAQTGGIKIKR